MIYFVLIVVFNLGGINFIVADSEYLTKEECLEASIEISKQDNVVSADCKGRVR